MTADALQLHGLTTYIYHCPAPSKYMYILSFSHMCMLLAIWLAFNLTRQGSWWTLSCAGVFTCGCVTDTWALHLLQLLGFSDWATGTLTVCTTLGAALGFLIGGGLSDFLAYRYPNAARPFINQLSAAMVLPLTVVLYKAAPGETACHLAECVWPVRLAVLPS